jgi:hypothetical protein
MDSIKSFNVRDLNVIYKRHACDLIVIDYILSFIF